MGEPSRRRTARLRSTGANTYNCGNRVSWISVGFATPDLEAFIDLYARAHLRYAHTMLVVPGQLQRQTLMRISQSLHQLGATQARVGVVFKPQDPPLAQLCLVPSDDLRGSYGVQKPVAAQQADGKPGGVAPQGVVDQRLVL
ncbi:hypothetical protein [Streptomyces sp. NPDC001601]|uniref:hypothetical protein n=1 Tax=Streptomyces sp. NPDC001601 TaxID=3364592 RepID=UPI0036BAC0BA